MKTLKNLVSFGNSKLPKNIAIFNLTSATDCPSKKLGLCSHPAKCYAMKSERMYKQVLPYRREQENYFDSVTSEQFINEFLELIRRKKNPVKYLRFNESGDIKTQNDVYKLEEIAKGLYNEAQITSYCYTHRSDLDFSKTNFLRVLSSNGKAKTKVSFYAVDEIPKTAKFVCKMDCSKCSLCATLSEGNIYVKYH